MEVVCLKCGSQAYLPKSLIDFAVALAHEVESESEKVLAVYIAPDSSIAGLVAVPAGKLNGRVEVEDHLRETDDPLVDWSKFSH